MLSLEVSISLLALTLIFAIVHGPILDAKSEKRVLGPEVIDGKCPLHDKALEEGIVPILYGIPDFTEDYWKAKRNEFPFANSQYLGGCYFQKPMLARVIYCPQCRKAEKEWKANAN